jgi:3',5'-cyclic AMP phosphodiesterase CpdA
LEIVHITDPHFGCEDEHALTAAEKLVAERRPAAVVVTGDISTEGLPNELEAAFAWMRRLEAPVLCTPGNHDVPYHDLWGRIVDPWGRFLRAADGVRLEAWRDPRWTIAPINTARGVQLRLNWAQGAINSAQTAEAAETLRGAAPGALRIVATHHPLDWPNDAPIKGRTIGGPRAQAALVEAGAQLFLAGHLHFASARMIGRRALSVTSGTLSRRVRHEPCALTVIRRPDADVIETELVHIVDGVCETATVRRFALEPSGELQPRPGPPDVGAAAEPEGALPG